MSVVFFLLVFSHFLNVTLSQYESFNLTSPWGITYYNLEIGSTHSAWLQNVTLIAFTTDEVIPESELINGTIPELYDEIYNDADHCIQADTSAGGTQDWGIYYVFKFTQTIQFYGTEVWLKEQGDEPNTLNKQNVKGYKDGTLLFNWKASSWNDFGFGVQWKTTQPDFRNETYDIDELIFFFGNKGDIVVSDWRICEIWLYGYLITDAPTTEPTLDPVAPTADPTIDPSSAPSQPPSMAPTGAPSEDPCPQFDITQPCCASNDLGGGYYFRNFTYDIYTNELVNDSDVINHCYVVINNQSTQCCANGNMKISTELINSNIEIECSDGTYGVDDVCDVGLYVSHINSTYYGAKGVSGYNTLYELEESNGNWYNCSCNYTVNICESIMKPICNTIDITEPNTNLCTTNTATSPFVGGGEINIQMYSNASIDYDLQSCECDYYCDHCANITKYQTLLTDFTYPGNNDNNSCTQQFIVECCSDSVISFGDVAINNLTHESYNALYGEDKYEWQCLNGDDLCDADGLGVPKSADKTLFFSYVFNETDAFKGNYLCECGIWYDNCTTASPTPETASPTTDPTYDPTLDPTLPPTVYRFSDYDSMDVIQPCCGNNNVSSMYNALANDTFCAPNYNYSVCSEQSFVGMSNEIVVNSRENVGSDGNCTCDYSVGYWNWTYNGDTKCLDDNIWPEVYDNITWNKQKYYNMSDDDHTESSCYSICISECSDINECIVDNQVLIDNKSHELYDIGYSYDWFYNYSSNGANGGLQQNTFFEKCYCYFMYEICVDPTFGPTFEPTTEPINISTSFMFNSSFMFKGTNTTEFLGEESEDDNGDGDDFITDPIGWFTTNYYISMAICGFLFLLCLACAMYYVQKKQKRRRHAERDELEKKRKENIAYDKAHRPHNPYAMTTMLSMSNPDRSVPSTGSTSGKHNTKSGDTLVAPKSKVEMHQVTAQSMSSITRPAKSETEITKSVPQTSVSEESSQNSDSPLKKHNKVMTASINNDGNDNAESSSEMHPDAFEFDDDGIDM